MVYKTLLCDHVNIFCVQNWKRLKAVPEKFFKHHNFQTYFSWHWDVIVSADVLFKFFSFQKQCFLANSLSIKEENMDTVIGRDKFMPKIKTKDSPESHEHLNEINEDNFAVG